MVIFTNLMCIPDSITAGRATCSNGHLHDNSYPVFVGFDGTGYVPRVRIESEGPCRFLLAAPCEKHKGL